MTSNNNYTFTETITPIGNNACIIPTIRLLNNDDGVVLYNATFHCSLVKNPIDLKETVSSTLSLYDQEFSFQNGEYVTLEGFNSLIQRSEFSDNALQFGQVLKVMEKRTKRCCMPSLARCVRHHPEITRGVPVKESQPRVNKFRPVSSITVLSSDEMRQMTTKKPNTMNTTIIKPHLKPHIEPKTTIRKKKTITYHTTKKTVSNTNK